MISIIKYFVIAIMIFFCNIPASSQSNEDCRYLVALTYLRTNTQINERAKMFFPKMFKKKDKFIEFNLSNRIDFLGIGDFKEKLLSMNCGIKEELLNDAKLYYKEYYFYSFRSTFLKGLVEHNDSKLFLTFSKPIDNYLVAELGNFDPELNQKIKFGKAMLIFFKFNPLGLIEEVLYAGSAYN